MSKGIEDIEIDPMGARGAFSAAAASQLGRGGDVDSKQLESMLKAEKLLKKIVDFVRARGPLVWGQ